MTEAAPAAEKTTKDVVPSSYRDKYKATGGTNGDFIATSLQKVSKDGVGSLQAVAKENKIDYSKWSAMNPGMQRMNLANVMRGRYLKGETVTILGKQYNIKHQIEDYTGKVENTDKAIKAIAAYLDLTDSDRVVAALKKVLFEPSAEEKAKAKADAKAAADKVKADAKAAKDKEKADAKAEKAKAAEEAKAKKAADKKAADEKKAADKAAADAKAKAEKPAEAK